MRKMQAKTDMAHKNSIGHWGRVTAMFLSFGFIFPHALSEYDDIVIKTDIEKAATVKK